MRTTVTLDPDVEALVRKVMRERGLTFKAAINWAIRSGLTKSKRTRFETPSFRMGFDPRIPWDKSLRLVGEMENEELIRKLAARK